MSRLVPLSKDLIAAFLLLYIFYFFLRYVYDIVDRRHWGKLIMFFYLKYDNKT